MPPETLEPARTILTHAPFQSIAWNGRNFLLVLPGETMELVLLSPDGDLVRTVIMDHAGGLSAAVASNGRSILGIALDDRTLRPFAIDATTRAVTVLTTETPLQGWNPIAATGGSRYLLSWTGMNGTPQTLPFDETAAPAAAAPRECCRGADSLPSLAWNGRSYFAAWGDARDSLPQTSSHHLYGMALDADGGAMDDGHPLASAARDQLAPSMAGALVVWAELDANDKYHEVRASLGGAPPVVLSQPALVDATVALFTGSSYFVGWSDRLTWSATPRVFLRRLGDAAPLPLGRRQRDHVRVRRDERPRCLARKPRPRGTALRAGRQCRRCGAVRHFDDRRFSPARRLERQRVSGDVVGGDELLLGRRRLLPAEFARRQCRARQRERRGEAEQHHSIGSETLQSLNSFRH